jgi:hypothetical protein
MAGTKSPAEDSNYPLAIDYVREAEFADIAWRANHLKDVTARAEALMKVNENDADIWIAAGQLTFVAHEAQTIFARYRELLSGEAKASDNG